MSVLIPGPGLDWDDELETPAGRIVSLKRDVKKKLNEIREGRDK